MTIFGLIRYGFAASKCVEYRAACQRSRPFWSMLCALVICYSLATAAHAQRTETLESGGALRQEFLDARASALNGTDFRTSKDSAQLRDYPLYRYLLAVRLHHRLREAESDRELISAFDDAQGFIAQYRGEPVVFGLHRYLLSVLARHEAWQLLVDSYDPNIATTAQRCRALGARIALGETSGLADAISQVWLSPTQLPLDCERPFEWLREDGTLDSDLIEARVRLLLENGQVGFARAIARRLPEERAAPLLRWARLMQNPISEFDALLAAPGSEVLPEALDAAWPRFARANPQAALDRFELLTETQALSAVRASRYTRDLALGLAWDRRAPEAIVLFRQVLPRHRDDYMLEWLARAALWQSDWRLALETIESMSASQQHKTVWRYWMARSLAQMNRRPEAEEYFRSVLQDDNYYSAMAAAYLGTRFEPHARTLPRNAKLILDIGSRPTFLRAKELYAVNLSVEATREWRFGYATLSPEERQQAIHVSADWKRFDTSIASATAVGIFDDYVLLYPLHFTAEVDAAARLSGLREALIFGLMRQESLYRPDAVSAAGAIGLTQLMPDTARRTAITWNLEAPDTVDLFDARTNVVLGSATLSNLLEQYGGQLPVALAAYNAGRRAAERWLPAAPMDSDIWIENIPYNETRAFVRRVTWHSLVYEWLQTALSQNTASWKTQVQPVVSDK